MAASTLVSWSRDGAAVR